MNLLLVLSCLLSAANPGESADGPVPAAAPAYRVLICLRAADRPILTPLFLATVAGQVRDQTANYLGNLAEVDVRTAGHWLLDDFRYQPVDEPEFTPALLMERRIQGTVFLVGLDWDDGLYQVSWRHLDAQTGLVGPLRVLPTPDRQWVSRAICLAIRDEFPLVADVEPGDSMQSVKLSFRGAGRESRINDLLGERCVLQPFYVLRTQQGLGRQAIKDTFLYVDKKHRSGTARVATNLSTPWLQRAVIAGFEAVKLSTQTGRLRIRLLDADTGLPVIHASVSANDQGFETLTESDILGRPDPDGYVLASREYRQLAFVQVTHGDSLVRVPVPITQPMCEHVIRLRVDRDASEKEEFRRSLRFLVQDLQSILTIQAEAVREFNELNTQKKYEEALSRIQSGLQFVDVRLQNARTSLVSLMERAKLRDESSQTLVQAAVEQITQVDERASDLRRLRDDIQEAIAKRDAQSRANVVIGLAQQFEKDGEIDEAILRFELALNEQPDQPALREKLDQLRKTWQLKGPDHEQVRLLIYQRWAQAEVTEIMGLLPLLRKALDTLKSHGDYLSARKLSIVNNAKLSQLNAIIDQLALRSSQEDQDELEKFAELTEQLADFQAGVIAYLEQALRAPTGEPKTVAPPSTTTEPAGNEPSLEPAGSPASVPPEEDEEPPIR
jgi:tetratricopeptide (TPR) repeat protein